MRPKKSPNKRSQKTITYVVGNMRSSCTRMTFKEIRRLQHSTHLLIPKLPFSRLVREIFMQLMGNYRIQSLALEALQEAAEKYLVDVLSDANRCSAHAKRATLFPSDLQLVLDIRGVQDPGNGIPTR